MTPEPTISILPDPAKAAVEAPPSPVVDVARKQHAEIGMGMGAVLWAGTMQAAAVRYADGTREGWTPVRLALLADALDQAEAGCRSMANSARLLQHVLSDPSPPPPLDNRAVPNDTAKTSTPA